MSDKSSIIILSRWGLLTCTLAGIYLDMSATAAGSGYIRQGLFYFAMFLLMLLGTWLDATATPVSGTYVGRFFRRREVGGEQ